MIIGNGLLANSFRGDFENVANVVIFASGVSNSNEKDDKEFERELELLTSTISNNLGAIIVYFSSCFAEDSNEHFEYFSHKLAMENVVKQYAENYYIFRLPQVVGSTTNLHTIINYFFANISSGTEFVVWDNCKRNLIDVDDVVLVVKYIIEGGLMMNETVNIASSVSYSALEIVKLIESFLSKKGNYSLKNKSDVHYVEAEQLSPIFSKLDIRFNNGYLENLLIKYYS